VNQQAVSGLFKYFDRFGGLFFSVPPKQTCRLVENVL
jgi:hypothetical protein